MMQASAPVCMEQDMANIADGIYKDVALTKAVWVSCPDVGVAPRRGGDPAR